MKDYYAPVVRDWIWPISRRLQKCNFTEKMVQARKNQRLSREELRLMQMEKLGALLQHACKYVPYYRDLFKQLGIKPEDIRTWEDYQDLPILVKADVREHYDQFFSEKPRSPLKKYRTSGSTGEPLKIFFQPDRHRSRICQSFPGLEPLGD
ncbi:hypothetical protein ACFLV7_07835 [Chloroflexota bacterium]